MDNAILNKKTTQNIDDQPIENQDKQILDENMQKLIKKDPWEEIGFQRPLGGFWFDLTIQIFSTIVLLGFVSLVYQYLYPYPEMQGYNQVAGGFFAIIYSIFDIGTAFGIERFIAEYRIKNVKKMLEYVRFFVWYQMFTGLIQVTAISSFIIFYLNNNLQLSYLSWLFLIICQKQWPGMLGTFKAVIRGLQKYNKSKILDFIGGNVFQNLTNVIFILLGRYWGQNTPHIGDLMGGAIGLALGAYIDDFFTEIVSAIYLQKELKSMGFSLIDVVKPKIEKDVIRNCLWFGFQASLVPILNIFSETYILIMFLNYLPQYTTWIVLKGFASNITGITNVGNFETTSSIAESYSNGKKELTQFYVANALKWNGFFKMLVMTTLIGLLPFLNQIIIMLPGLDRYEPALIFIPFLLVEWLFFPFIEISDPILIGTLHVGFYTFVRLLEEVIRIFILHFLLVTLQLPIIYGAIGVVLTLGYDRFYARMIKMVIALAYINKRVFKVKIYLMPTLLIPALCGIPFLIFINIWRSLIFENLVNVIGFYPSVAIILIISIFIFPIFIFFPLTGFFGGFDDFQLETFKKAVNLSGPSKPLVKILYKAVEWGHYHCKWKNKFQIPWNTAIKQIQELHQEKSKNTPKLN